MNKARFIYFCPSTNEALLMLTRYDLAPYVLLFTCPEDWAPKNQQEFVMAATYYGVIGASSMKYNSDADVPF